MNLVKVSNRNHNRNLKRTKMMMIQGKAPMNIELGQYSYVYNNTTKKHHVPVSISLVSSSAIDNEGCLAALYPIIGRSSIQSTHNNLLLYNAIIRPVLPYASPETILIFIAAL